MEESRWARGGLNKQPSRKFTTARRSGSSPTTPLKDGTNEVATDKSPSTSPPGASTSTGMLIGSHVSSSRPDRRPVPKESELPKEIGIPSKDNVKIEFPNDEQRKVTNDLDPELEKVYRIVRRLRWKTAALSCSFDRAKTSALVGEVEASGRRLDEFDADAHLAGLAMDPFKFLSTNGTPTLETQNAHGGSTHRGHVMNGSGTCNSICMDPGSMAAHAESMFKLDFFEYYNLLERALTVCYTLCRVHISHFREPIDSNQQTRSKSAGDANGTNSSKDNTNETDLVFGARGRTNHTSGELLKSRFAGQHRYHAAVLDALDQSTNPLKPILGEGTGRYWLGFAKDLRNRWKDADEQREINGSPSPGNRGSSKDRSKAWHSELKNLELGTMISTILWGMERAVGVVEKEIEGRKIRKTDHGCEASSSDVLTDSDMVDAEIMAEYGIETVEDGMDID